MKPIRVLVADDHELVRAGFRALLKGVNGIEVVAEASNGREALEQIVGDLESGGPTIIGAWLGGVSYSPLLGTLCMAVGAGAILQVMVEVGAYLARSGGGKPWVLASPAVIGGIAAGITVMFATGMLVKV